MHDIPVPLFDPNLQAGFALTASSAGLLIGMVGITMGQKKEFPENPAFLFVRFYFFFFKEVVFTFSSRARSNKKKLFFLFVKHSCYTPY